MDPWRIEIGLLIIESNIIIDILINLKIESIRKLIEIFFKIPISVRDFLTRNWTLQNLQYYSKTSLSTSFSFSSNRINSSSTDLLSAFRISRDWIRWGLHIPDSDLGRPRFWLSHQFARTFRPRWTGMPVGSFLVYIIGEGVINSDQYTFTTIRLIYMGFHLTNSLSRSFLSVPSFESDYFWVIFLRSSIAIYFH